MNHVYCKAYLLRDVRQFNEWTEKLQEGQQAYSDDDVCYIWDDFTVVNTPIPGKESIVLFDAVTPEWQAFCKTTLKFEIPEDLSYAYEKTASA